MRFLQVRSEPASASEIAQGLHLKKTDNRPLFKMLSKLRKRGAIENCPADGTASRAASRNRRRPAKNRARRRRGIPNPRRSRIAMK